MKEDTETIILNLLSKATIGEYRAVSELNQKDLIKLKQWAKTGLKNKVKCAI